MNHETLNLSSKHFSVARQKLGAPPPAEPAPEIEARKALGDAIDAITARFALIRKTIDDIAEKKSALQGAVAAVKNESAILQAVNARIQPAPEKFQLNACSFLAPDLIVADITFAPETPLLVKPGSSQVVQIKGGGKNDAFSAVPQKSDVAGVKVTPVGPRSILVEAASGAAADYVLPVLVTGTFSGKSAALEVKGK